MNRAERRLLLELFRWARAEGGLEYGGLYTWARRGLEGPGRWGITFYANDWEPGEPVSLEIWRNRQTAKAYWVASIAEAVDLVVALGIAPARFSTTYRAGWDAANRYAEVAHCGDEWRSVRPAARRELAVGR